MIGCINDGIGDDITKVPPTKPHDQLVFTNKLSSSLVPSLTLSFSKLSLASSFFPCLFILF